MRYLIAAAACALLGLSSVTAQADETSIEYNLKAGTCKVLAPFSPANVPIHVMGVNSTEGFLPGIGEVTITSFTHFNSGDVLMWVGTDSNTNTVFSNFSSAPDTHIMWLGPEVEVQVWNGIRIRVCNLSDANQRGTITMFQ
jgi:hypothetical protein